MAVATEKKVNLFYNGFLELLEEIKSCSEDTELVLDSISLKFIEASIIKLNYLDKKILFRIYFRKKKVTSLNSFPKIDSFELSSSFNHLEKEGLIENALPSSHAQLLDLLKKHILDSLIKEFKVNCKKTTMADKRLEILNHISCNTTLHSFFSTEKTRKSQEHPIILKAKQLLGKCFKLSLPIIHFFDRIFFYLDLKTDLNLQSQRINTRLADIGQSILLSLNQLQNKTLCFPLYEWKRISFISTFYISHNNFLKHLAIFPKYLNIINATRRKELLDISNYYKEFHGYLLSTLVELQDQSRYDLFHACIVKGCSKISDALQSARKYSDAIALLNSLLQQKRFSQKYRGHWYTRLVHIYCNSTKQVGSALEICSRILTDELVLDYYRYAIFKKCSKILSRKRDHELYVHAMNFLNSLREPTKVCRILNA